MFTRFMDMHSGGGQKEDHAYIYIEAPEQEAKLVFYNRFGHSPDRVSCTCCGPDYSIDDADTLEMSSAYDRGCKWADGGYDLSSSKISIEEYESKDSVLVIRAGEITSEQRTGEVPEEGYVWH